MQRGGRIVGLQGEGGMFPAVLKRTSRKDSRTRCARAALIESLEPRQLLSSTSGDLVALPAVPLMPTVPAAQAAPSQGYTPGQIRQAYGFSAASQPVAVVAAYDDPNIVSDLHVFDQAFGLPDPFGFNRLNQTGGAALPAANAGWARETSLDIEWAHAVAPGARLALVEARSNHLDDLLAAVDTARHLDNVSVVSMSWGVNEFPDESDFDSYFTTPDGHTGVTFVGSAGDVANSPAPQWPATSPNVLAVGGTSLAIGSNGNAISEDPWAGSVSGTSQYEPPPAYQGTGAAPAAAAGRTTPDVGYNGDPLTGFAVYDSVPIQDQAGWAVLGGTSAGAPQWAALVAIANQKRARDGQLPLDGASTTIPSVYQFYSQAANTAGDASANTFGASAPAAAPPTGSTTDFTSGTQRNLTAVGGSVQVISALTFNAKTVPQLPPAPLPGHKPRQAKKGHPHTPPAPPPHTIATPAWLAGRGACADGPFWPAWACGPATARAGVAGRSWR